jgi:hypothetical protein
MVSWKGRLDEPFRLGFRRRRVAVKIDVPDEDPSVVLRPKFGTTLTVEDKPSTCSHQSVGVCAQDRTVACNSCGAPLDAINVLLQYAHAERRFSYRRGDLAALRKRVGELKDEEKRVKARLRRAQKKEADNCDVSAVCPHVRHLSDMISNYNREVRRLQKKAGE